MKSTSLPVRAFCLAVAVALAGVCVWAEVLNAQAGHVFPRHYDAGDGGNHRFVSGMARAEQHAHELVMRQRGEKGENPDVPLSQAEQVEIRRFVEHTARYNALGTWVRDGWPCLLYPLTGVVLLWAALLTWRARRRRAAFWMSLAAVLVTSAVGATLLYRNYWEAVID